MNDRLRIFAVALEPVEQCPLCKAAERTLFERAASPPEQIQLMRCDQCGFIYTSAVVPAGDVARVYEAYNAARDAESAQLRDQRLQMYAIDGAFARRYLRPGTCSASGRIDFDSVQLEIARKLREKIAGARADVEQPRVA